MASAESDEPVAQQQGGYTPQAEQQHQGEVDSLHQIQSIVQYGGAAAVRGSGPQYTGVPIHLRPKRL